MLSANVELDCSHLRHVMDLFHVLRINSIGDVIRCIMCIWVNIN